MPLIRKQLLAAVLPVLFLFSACKKNEIQPSGTSSEDRLAQLKDSVLDYSRDIYLWYNQIPAGFNARSYPGPQEIMTALRQYSVENGFSQPVDRWSFAIGQSDWDNASSGISTGDFGLNVFFRQEGDLRVRFVERDSPAGRAGVRRGWRIMGINQVTNITTAHSDFIVQSLYRSNSAQVNFQKPDGSLVSLSLGAATYREHPVVLDTVYQASGRKTGYLVFNSFLGDTTEIYGEFDRVFQRFAREGVSDVAIDLRYNGGGYVTVASRLANYLAPAAADGALMMTQQFNDKYAHFNSTEVFRKRGTLDLSRLFFIVSNSSASASELLINNLKPYLDVQLVGPSRTYGKPVGYFPVPVDKWYIFPVSFKTTNKNGEGNYYNGLALNHTVADGLDKDWGDASESALSSVLAYVQRGAYRTSARERAPEPQVPEGNEVLDAPRFKGTVDPRFLH